MLFHACVIASHVSAAAAGGQMACQSDRAAAFRNSTDVLSMSVLTTMAVMLVSIFVVPAAMFFISRRSHTELVPIYMNGINEGDNRFFTNSYGEKEHLYLSNWYLRFEFGRRTSEDSVTHHRVGGACHRVLSCHRRCVMVKVIFVLAYLILAPFLGALLDGVDRIISARMPAKERTETFAAVL